MIGHYKLENLLLKKESSKINLPFVTVIVTNFNYEKYIKDCLNSIAEQTYTNYKCIVVDDCSTDNSVKIIEQFIKSRDNFTLIRREENGGQMAAFKTGLSHAEGPFVVFVDADDLLFDNFLETHLRRHMNGTPVAFTSSNQIQIDEFSCFIGGKHADLMTKNRPRLIIPQDIHNPFWVWATTSSMMFRRSVLELIVPDDTDNFRVCADNYICHFANLIGGSLLIPETLGAYRRHGRNFFSQNPVIGGRLPTGDMRKHPKHHIVRLNILEHLLKYHETFISVLGEGKFYSTLLHVTGPYEILKYKRKFPDYFKNNDFPMIRFIALSFLKKVIKNFKRNIKILQYVIKES